MVQKILITGIAGFIGSHTALAAKALNWQVIGIDSITDYYDTKIKWNNLEKLNAAGITDIHQTDLLDCDLKSILKDVDVVLHCAAQPGVRDSWTHFDKYVTSNILATQKLLEACTKSDVKRLVYSSSSSVYGDLQEFPVLETNHLNPVSPYGITKLAAEHLCSSYSLNSDLSVVSLRYFTVYGPGQRPDMAIHRLINSALHQTPFPLFGDGSFIRDFTFVTDVARANLAALANDIPSGTIINIAGGESTSMSELIRMVEKITGNEVPLDRRPVQAGDVVRTGGDTTRAKKYLNWTPEVSLHDGLKRQYESLSTT
jgi:nucleoside-diphosphate-sugar epimerase